MGCSETKQKDIRSANDHERKRASDSKSPAQAISPKAYQGKELGSDNFQATSVTEKRDLENAVFALDMVKKRTEVVVSVTDQAMFDLQTPGVVDKETKQERERYYNQYQSLNLGMVPSLVKTPHEAEVTLQEVQFIKLSFTKIGNALKSMNVLHVEPFVVDYSPISLMQK